MTKTRTKKPATRRVRNVGHIVPKPHIAMWVAELFGIDSSLSPDVCMPRTPKPRTGSRLQLECLRLCYSLASFGFTRLLPISPSKCNSSLFEIEDTLDLLEEDPSFPTWNDNILQYLISFSEPVFARNGVVIVGFEDPYPKTSMLEKALLGNDAAKEARHNLCWNGYWICLYRRDALTMVYDPQRKKSPCTLGRWLEDIDFYLGRIKLELPGFNKVFIFGVGKSRKMRSSRIQRKANT